MLSANFRRTGESVWTGDGERSVSEQLDLLAQMGRDFAAKGDIKAAMARALERIAALVGAEGGALFLLDEAGENLICRASYGPVDIHGLTVPAGHGIVGRSVAGLSSEMVRDVAADPHFQGAVDEKTGFTTRSILCAPMAVKDERIGAIELVNKTGTDGLFVDADLKFLEALAASAGLAILNARMASELAEQEVMRRELELAAEIQRGLLPPRAAAESPIAGVNRPARVVSGDFYDYFTLYDGRIAFTLADVSGKGMNAALLMAKAASLFRCLGKEDLRPGRLLQRINAEICETSLRGMFVTMVAGTYDPDTGRVVLANAGHEPPLVHAPDGTFTALEAAAPPVGIPPELTGGGPVAETVLHLNGGALYLFTDGVTEGYVAEGRELGGAGFEALIREHSGQGEDGRTRVEAVAARITASGVPLRDDVTIMVLDDSGPAQTRQTEKPGASDDLAAVTPAAPVDGEMGRLSVPGRAESLALIRRAVEAGAQTCGFAKEQAQDIVLAVDEACQNVVRHAYGGRGHGDIVVELRREQGSYHILIRDFAEAVDADKIKPRELDDVRPGGLGVHFMREVMDAMEYLPPPDGQGNLLRLTKAIPA